MPLSLPPQGRRADREAYQSITNQIRQESRNPFQKVSIDNGFLSRAIPKRLFRRLFKSALLIKFPRHKRVYKKPDAVCPITFRPLQELRYQRGFQTFSVIPFGWEGDKLQIAFPKNFLIPFLWLTDKSIKLFLKWRWQFISFQIELEELFTPQTIVSIDTTQLYRENQENQNPCAQILKKSNNFKVSSYDETT